MVKKPKKNHPWRNAPISPSRKKLGIADYNSITADRYTHCQINKDKKQAHKFPGKQKQK